MKKIILTVFAALMALTVFTGCEYKADYAEENASGDKNKTITISSEPNVSGGWWKEACGIDKNAEAFYFNLGDWASYNIDLKTPINCDNAKVTIEMYGVDLKKSGSNPFKIELATSADCRSEYGNYNFIDIDELCEATADEPYKVSFSTNDMMTAWKYSKPAYLPLITQIGISPQDSCSGKLFIKSIKVANK